MVTMIDRQQYGAPRVNAYDDIVIKNMIRTVYIIVGASGGGKTLLMTEKTSRGLIIAHWLNNEPYLREQVERYQRARGHAPRPIRVWANYEVGFNYCPADDGAEWAGANRTVELVAENLEFEKMYTFDPEMKFGFCFIDELDQKADRQDWQNGGQKLLMMILRQIRKRHLSLTGSIQSENWLNPRFLFQVDLETKVRDSSFTGWGQANHIQGGEVVFLYTKDRSGRTTGYMYEETGEIYQSVMIGRNMFPFYSTDEEKDPFDSFDSYHVKRRRIEIDPHADELEGKTYDRNLTIISTLVKEQILSGEYTPLRSEYSRKFNELGGTMLVPEVTEYLKTTYNVLTLNHSGNIHYDFRAAKNLPFKAPKELQAADRKRVKRLKARGESED